MNKPMKQIQAQRSFAIMAQHPKGSGNNCTVWIKTLLNRSRVADSLLWDDLACDSARNHEKPLKICVGELSTIGFNVLSEVI